MRKTYVRKSRAAVCDSDCLEHCVNKTKSHRTGWLFSLFARHGRALTGVSPEHAQVVGNV
jgi:hypothetical protein